MRKLILIILVIFALWLMSFGNEKLAGDNKNKIVFAVMAENIEQLKYSVILAESMRMFAGKYRHSPFWIMIPDEVKAVKDKVNEIDKSLNIIFKKFKTPTKALDFVIARKVFAASKAEQDAIGKTEVLVWMDKDTVFLNEPGDFYLNEGINFGYKPVMHRLIGSLYNKPLDTYWSRVYKLLSVKKKSVFSMQTPADNVLIRPYFNAGLLVVRPEKKIFKNWALNFIKLYNDPEIKLECKNNFKKRIFLHQVALAGTVLNLLDKVEMIQFNKSINYPLFFKRMFGAKENFNNISNAVTIRYDIYFRNPEPDWSKKLKGSKAKIKWLKLKFNYRKKQTIYQ